MKTEEKYSRVELKPPDGNIWSLEKIFTIICDVIHQRFDTVKNLAFFYCISCFKTVLSG